MASVRPTQAKGPAPRRDGTLKRPRYHPASRRTPSGGHSKCDNGAGRPTLLYFRPDALGRVRGLPAPGSQPALSFSSGPARLSVAARPATTPLLRIYLVCDWYIRTLAQRAEGGQAERCGQDARAPSGEPARLRHRRVALGRAFFSKCVPFCNIVSLFVARPVTVQDIHETGLEQSWDRKVTEWDRWRTGSVMDVRAAVRVRRIWVAVRMLRS